ncbi:MAG: hypothetical protein H7Z75_13890 [Ferruginibacter sp.]|nr:hypothetical protein [Cytophagales bacterium]
MKNVNHPFIMLFAAGTVLVTACRQHEEATPAAPQAASTAATDQAYALATFDDALALAGESMQSANAGGRVSGEQKMSSCVRVTHNQDDKMVTLDFGATGCAAAGGRIRTGKITIFYVGRYREPDSSLRLTFDNYAVEGNQVGGTVYLSGTRQNPSGQPEYRVTVEDGFVKFQDNGQSIALNMTRTQVWTTGADTPQQAADDAFAATYSGDLTDRNGTYYAVSTFQPLLLKGACATEGYYYPVSGTVSFQPATGPAWALDFGTGACDKQAQLTFGRVVYPIELR